MHDLSSPAPVRLSLFVSYCRRECSFVNHLFDRLEEEGYPVWLDYHSLIPGQPWLDQINTGIATADTVLLVISHEAIASKNVEYEWRKAIALNKRIVLLIFEAVPLPVELHCCEWIDFRGTFNRAVKKLQVQLELPATQAKSAPQEGFKVSRWIWLTVAIAAVVSLLSLVTWWTLYIPFYLVPLPYRILKRDVNYFRVQNALLMLPFAIFLEAIRYPVELDSWQFTFFVSVWLGSFLFVPLLSLLLRSPAMRRWGKTVATRPRFVRRVVSQLDTPRPLQFLIDHAPEDARYAESIGYKLKQHGHVQVADNELPEVVIVLLSEFKRSSDFDPERLTLYPVILQTNHSIDPKLQRIQWIDYRRGVRHLDRFAKLLPEPTKLLKSLGIIPLGDQIIVPAIVQGVVFYLTFMAVLILGGWVTFAIDNKHAFSLQGALFSLLLIGSFLTCTIVTIQSLIRRGGWVKSLWRLTAMLLLLGALSTAQLFFIVLNSTINPAQSNPVSPGNVAMLIQALYILGVGGLFLICAWYWRDLLRWFPSRVSKRLLKQSDISMSGARSSSR